MKLISCESQASVPELGRTETLLSVQLGSALLSVPGGPRCPEWFPGHSPRWSLSSGPEEGSWPAPRCALLGPWLPKSTLFILTHAPPLQRSTFSACQIPADPSRSNSSITYVVKLPSSAKEALGHEFPLYRICMRTDPGCPASRTVRDQCWLFISCISCPVCGVLLECPEWAKAGVTLCSFNSMLSKPRPPMRETAGL